MQTPGVYIRSVEPPAQLRAIRTDVAAFVGIAERGPLHTPVRVSSFEEFRSRFGGPRPAAYLPLSTEAFFRNGGRVCWIVRVADPEVATSAHAFVESSGAPRLEFRATSPGVWGRFINARLAQSVRSSTTMDGATGRLDSLAGIKSGSLIRIRQDAGDVWGIVRTLDRGQRTLTWFVEPVVAAGQWAVDVVTFAVSVYERGRLVEQHDGLSPRSFAEATAETFEDVTTASARIAVNELGADPLALPDLGDYPLNQDGADGLKTLRWGHIAGDDSSGQVWGLDALREIDEIGIVAVPDAVSRPSPILVELPPRPAPTPCVPCEPEAPPPAPPAPPGGLLESPPPFSLDDTIAIQHAMLTHCERARDRFAILDAPRDDLDNSELLDWRNSFDSSYGAAYYPWLTISDPKLGTRAVGVPPSGHLAGSYARTDLTEGVHRVAANQPLRWTVGVTEAIDERVQAGLNPVGINCIRAFPGRGIRAFGARTMSSNTLLRFINVRRLLMMIAEVLEEQLAWAVFEPHNFVLRQKVILVANAFLQSLWSAGALRGEQPADAFFVRCDDVTNPPDAVARGEIHALIGVAIVRPAEFVLVRLGRTDGRIEIEEGGEPWSK